MKSLFLFAAVLLISIHVLASTHITSYNINAEFSTDRISVKAGLIFKTDQQPDTLCLLFNPNCRIQSINNAVNEQTFSLKYSRGNKDTLLVHLNENMKYAGNFIINFEYEYSLENDSIILLDRGHKWYPMIAEDIFPFTLTVQVPQNYLAISAGDIINVNTEAGFRQISYESTQPVFKIPLIIAPENYYTLHEKECGKIKSYFYEIKKGESELDSINADICNLINYFSNTIGEYSHKRFTLVETSAFPGSNLGSSIVVSGTGNFESYSKDYKDWLKMAIASQWVGAGIFPKLFCKGFWFLSISFPHYLRLMYDRDTRGEEIFNEELDNLKETYKKTEGSEEEIPIIDIDYPNTKEKGILLYAKGVIVLNNLKNKLGESNWINLLKYFYTQYYGKVILLDDFIGSINQFDPSGICSKNFLDMLSTKGMPE